MFPKSILLVLLIGSREEVVWVDAPGVIAVVTDELTLRDRTHEKLVRNPMSLTSLSTGAKADGPISVTGNRTSPHPAP